MNRGLGLRLALFLALLGFALAQNTDYTPDQRWQPPPAAAARSNPLANNPGAAAGGQKLFTRHCVDCHAADGSGIKRKHAANLQLPMVQDQSDGTLFWKITNGNPPRGMPSWSRLPELQRWQLVLYLRTLKQQGQKARQ
jgi:mono/diheme cytochrome c family protein